MNPHIQAKFNLNALTLPLLTFTSLDGDDLLSANEMSLMTLETGGLPINPMIILDSFIVVDHFKRKAPILMLCGILIQMCENFCVMFKGNISCERDIFSLPEGIIAEIAYWLNMTRSKAIRFVNFDTKNETLLPVNPDFFEEYLKKETALNCIYELVSSHEHTKTQTEYVLIHPKDLRYVQFIIKNAYLSEKVAIVPDIILTRFHMMLMFNNDPEKQLLYRLALALKCDKVCIYSREDSDSFRIGNLPEALLLEIAFIHKFKPEMRMSYQSLSEINLIHGHYPYQPRQHPLPRKKLKSLSCSSKDPFNQETTKKPSKKRHYTYNLRLMGSQRRDSGLSSSHPNAEHDRNETWFGR
ncbi:MAG: hypothetical protein ACOYKA_03245 [Legionellaceae bacterium]